MRHISLRPRWWANPHAASEPLHDPRSYICTCPEPDPQPCTLFGCAMGGYPECGICHRPVISISLPYVSLLALTTGQRLVFAICAFVFVVVFVVWPVVRPRPHAPSEFESMRKHRRLMREIRRH